MSILASILVVIFLAVLIKAILGFGDALIAMPLLTLLMGIHVAIPLVGLVGACISGLMLAQRWQAMETAIIGRLLLSAAVGTPVGILLLRVIPVQLVNPLLGLILIVYSAYTLIQPVWTKLEDARWAYLFGFVSGALGSAYNTSGPPMVIYASLRRGSAEEFQTMLQGFFFPSSLMIIASHALSGLWTPLVFYLFALSLPLMLVALWLGSVGRRQIPGERFAQLVRIGLMILGIVLLTR